MIHIPKPPRLPRPGDVVSGRYRITSIIGKGGFGTVYRAHQTSIGRDVALKCMAPELARDPKNIERFRREALHISQLCHPNTVTLYDYGSTRENLFYIVLELLEGDSLSSVVSAAGGLGSDRAGHIFEQICSSLAEAHQHGIVHRDLKPDNILLCEMHGDPDYVKVLDFGLAKGMTFEDQVGMRLTAEGKVFGTPMYMAPEQVCGEAVTTATDVYALGLLFFEILTGELPVKGNTRLKVLRAQLNDPVPELTPELERHAFGGLIRRCTSKDAAARYRDAAELLKAVRLAWGQSGTLAPGSRERNLEREEVATRETRELGRAPAPVSPRPQPPRPPRTPRPPISPVSTSAERLTARSSSGTYGTPHRIGVETATLEQPRSSRTPPPLMPPGMPGALNRDAFCRGPELRELETWVEGVLVNSAPQIVSVLGEPGGGKSRLLMRFFHGLTEDGRIRAGRGVCRGEGRHPMDPLREALADVVDTSDLDAWAASEAAAGPPVIDAVRLFMSGALPPGWSSPGHSSAPSGGVSRLIAGLGRFLSWVSIGRAIVLVLDDVEHASFALCAFVEHVVMAYRADPRARLGIVLAGRVDGVEQNPEMRALLRRYTEQTLGVNLRRLTRARCDAFVEALLPASDAVKGSVYQLSQGIPLFVMQILRFLYGSGRLTSVGGAFELVQADLTEGQGPPDDLLELLTVRIEQAVDRHPDHPGLKLVLQWLALLGHRTPIALLETALGYEPRSGGARRLRVDLHILMSEGLLRQSGDGVIAFDHVLVRDALMLQVNRMRSSRRWQLRAAEAKQSYAAARGGQIPHHEIANHYNAAGMHDAYLEHLACAGRIAEDNMERRKGRALYLELLRGIESIPDPHTSLRIEALSALAELTESLGDIGPAEDYYKLAAEAAEAAGDVAERIKALRGRARVLLLQHKLDTARPLAEMGVELARREDDRLELVQGLVVLSEIASRGGDSVGCVNAVGELRHHLSTLSDARVLGRTELHLGELAKRSGKSEDAISHQREALEHFESVGDLQGISDALCALGFHAVERGEASAAEAELERALDLKEAIADRQGIGQVLNNLGLQALRRGDFARAEELLVRSLAIFRAMGAIYSVANGLINLGLIYSTQRRYDEADASFVEALDSLKSVGDKLMASMCLTNRGILAINRGQRIEARAHFRESRRLKEELGSSWGMTEVLVNLAFVAAWDGEMEAAERLLAQLLEDGAALSVAEANVTRSLLGVVRVTDPARREEGVATLREAYEGSSEAGLPQVHVLCRANLVFGLLLVGERKEATALLNVLRPDDVLSSIEPAAWLRWIEAICSHLDENVEHVVGTLRFAYH